jgi:hypothetical protein
LSTFDFASRKWPALLLSLATFLLVNISAGILRWQNPADACFRLFCAAVVRWQSTARKMAG